MALSELRYTVLEVVNEVQRKLSLTQTSTLTQNKLATVLVDHINDVVSELSDYGNWQETLVTANITAQSSVADYSIPTSAVVKNIGNIFVSNRVGPLLAVPVDQMRIMTRVTAYGTPTQFSIFGTDANGNPNIRIRPTPIAGNLPATFSVLYYVKPPMYTTADASVIIPFPARVVVLGTLAHYILEESEGAPTPQYQMYFQQYDNERRESLNRYNYDTGYTINFTPGWSGRRSRR